MSIPIKIKKSLKFKNYYSVHTRIEGISFESTTIYTKEEIAKTFNISLGELTK